MKKVVIFFSVCSLLLLAFMSCKTTGKSKSGNQKLKVMGKKPEMIEHKNQKWGKEPPEWVFMSKEEIAKSGTYGDSYIFKFESERAKDLEGAQIWLKNFTVASEISRMVSARVSDVAVSAAEGNKEAIASFTKELTKIVSEAQINGLKKEDDYWTRQRYYTADGDVEGDFYSIITIYSVPKKILDQIIKEALKKANMNVPAKTEEEKDVRETVKRAFDSVVF